MKKPKVIREVVIPRIRAS